ncbi:hypothetical protein HC231_13020 [Brenneria izadpanahii]|uniref:GspL periplasmic domain-containing protein n=1 Tax=Brenneria izadpanahii TaxID=2722756 RepID=A0ABX7UYT4_9GAMM|nr:type II secretion system protein GspL [Brenneria izadpanahii]QTF08719.1 hypothetical protein HC231_13020 [Brenneria izadpanahii]
MKVDLLRLVLPPSQGDAQSPLRCAWRTPQGRWQSAAHDDPAAISRLYQARRIEACPHPADVAMAEVELPPLPVKRLRIAVLGALEPLALTPPESLSVGFGARAANGKVPVAWADAALLRSALQELRRHGLMVRAVYPPPAFLPCFDAQAATAVRFDDWVIVRAGVSSGCLYPLAEERLDMARVAQRVQGLHPDVAEVRWLPAMPEHAVESASEPMVWQGDGWSWSMSVMGEANALSGLRWALPAAGWGCAVAAIWLTGLNLYAAQTDVRGKALNRMMTEQVKTAFPDIPVVIDPLQQARQQRDARRGNGVSAGTDADFPALIRAAANLLPQADGQIQRLEYRDGQLSLQPRAGAAFSGEELRALREQARERGLAIRADGDGLFLQADAEAGNTP